MHAARRCVLFRVRLCHLSSCLCCHVVASQLLIAAVREAGAEGVFDADAVEDLERKFRAHARVTKDGEYFLDTAGFVQVCKEIGIRDKGIIESLFRKWDADRSGAIEFDEFLHVIAFSRRASAREKLATSFDLMDSNHDGTITHGEMATFFRTVYRAIGKPKAPSQVSSLVNQVFARLDKDRSQAVDKHEFMAAASSVHLSTGDTLVALMDAMMERFSRITSEKATRVKSGVDVDGGRAGAGPALGASKTSGAAGASDASAEVFVGSPTGGPQPASGAPPLQRLPTRD